jgi:prepilin-type N-terminal cleavage/methylation domain-containing protein
MAGIEQRSDAAGFTLIEVIVSSALLVTVVAGTAQLTIVAAEACRAARVRTATALIAAQKMEQLRSLVWSSGESGALLSDGSTDVSREPPASGGGGLLATPAGTLDRNVDGYVDYLDAGGRWLAGGVHAPAGAVYLRRWAVLPLAADPDHTRILIVLATTMRQERVVEGRAAPRPRLPDDTVLVGLKTRQAAKP